MELRKFRSGVIVALALATLPAHSQSNPAPTFADAVAMLDQARDASDPAKELELTKKAWSIIQQSATLHPSSDLAIKFASRDSIGRVNLSAVYETLCLLEPTPPCLAELAWTRREAARQNQVTGGKGDAYDPASIIIRALADVGQFQLARTYAARLGITRPDDRRELFAYITRTESRLVGRDRALQALASIPVAEDRAAAAEALPLTPSQQQRSKLQALVQSTSGGSNDQAQRLTQIIADQVTLGFADDAKSTVDVLIAATSDAERVEESAMLAALRVSSIALHLVGDHAGSRKTLTRLCEYRLPPSRSPWLMGGGRERQSQALMHCGIAQALTGNPQPALDTSLRADAFERSVITTYLIEPLLRQEKFVEAFAAAKSTADQHRDDAVQYVSAAALAKGRRAEALEFARVLKGSEKRATSILLVAKRDLDANRRPEARALLEEVGRLPRGTYESSDWRLASAMLYARLGDLTASLAIVKSETEHAVKNERLRLDEVAMAYAMLRQFGDARNAVAAIPNRVDQIGALMKYAIGASGCTSNFDRRWGIECRGEWQFRSTYFPREAIRWNPSW